MIRGATKKNEDWDIKKLDLKDPYDLMNLTAYFGRKVQEITEKSLESKAEGERPFIFDPARIQEAFSEASLKLMENPLPAYLATQVLLKDYFALLQETAKKTVGQTDATSDIIAPEPGDRRFSDEAWQSNPYFDFLKQSYLLWDRWVKDITTSVTGLDEKTAHKLQFYSRQITDALAPSNYLFSNPKALKKAIESNGQSVVDGVHNLLKDLEEGKGYLNIKMVKKEAFEVGKNIAITPGKVVFQNDLMQLVQYAPTTKEVFRHPLLLVPPCINRFYIFDLRENNSFIKWALDKGFTVFVVSWVNPDEALSHKTYEDYVFEGVKKAIDVALEITKEDKINALGYCIGGNFLTTLSGYLVDSPKNPLLTTTYLATLFDFEKAGDLLVFIDEKQLDDIEKHAHSKGYLAGETLARTFNLLRANDLIWSFVVNNYLLGEEPLAFDLLYWNSDGTNLPATMYIYYLRNMFLKNLLAKENALKIKDKFLDLKKVKIPSFILNTKDDHIAPWWCGYAGARLFSGPKKFILGGSGHVAGIFNHPTSNKYGYWEHEEVIENEDKWLEKASYHPGSWWEGWMKWLLSYNKEKVPARQPGSKKYPPLEEAPGSFVKK
jgi:polyhydroxyalkanoate synthase